MKKKSIITLVIVALVLLALIGGAVYAAYSITNSPKNLPKIYVGDIFVGGMDSQQTEKSLNDSGWKNRCDTALTVTSIAGQSFEIDPVQSGYTLSVKDAVKLAHQYGHDGNMFENLFAYIKNIFSPVEINSLYRSAKADYIQTSLDSGIEQIVNSLGESEYVVDYEAATMTLIKGWGQLEFNEVDFSSKINQALMNGETSLTYTTLAKELNCPDFKAIHNELNKEVVNASYTEDGKFDVIDEVLGCNFDPAEAEKLWNEAAPGEIVTVPLQVEWPEVTGEFLRNQLYHDLLGAVTTKYPNSGEQRRSNLRLATSKINDMILYPGDEFSFNTVVGERTEAAGFLPAPAYVDGDVADEIGGGVCQVSSTLYAATAFAFLEAVERECHYFPVNYMQMGTDATVTIPAGGGRAIDFKFRNNKNFPIKIVGYCDNENSTITFEIWGTLEEGDYMPVKFDNSYTWQFDYMREVEAPYSDRPGYTIKLDHETYSGNDDVGNFYRTLTHRYVIDENGTIVKDDIINMKMKNGNFSMDTYYQH